MPIRYTITRPAEAPQTRTVAREPQASYLINGEQYEWGWAIPNVYRLLAAPAVGVEFPAAPSADRTDSAHAYWASLLQLLYYSFGWPRPDRGLAWWYASGFRVDDPRLALIDQLWRSDGQLDWFASWLWLSPPTEATTLLKDLSGHDDGPAPAAFDPARVNAAIDSATRTSVPNPAPTPGGSDPLHLQTHCMGPMSSQPSPSMLVVSEPEARRAVLLLDSTRGWYRALATRGRELPHLHGRSWRVDVISKPIGHLGTFRLSRVTGLWFSGRHEFHMRGT